MRVLVVTNLTPDAGAPSRGSFVRDQVAALDMLAADAGGIRSVVSDIIGLDETPDAFPRIRAGEALKVVVALGAFAWAAWWPAMTAVYGVKPPVPRPAFGHGALVSQPGVPDLVGCYHVSQQNTFTGRLTPAMLDDIFASVKRRTGLA